MVQIVPQGLGVPAEQMAELFANLAALPMRVIKDAVSRASPAGSPVLIQQYIIPANTLVNVGDVLRITALTHIANNVNAKDTKLQIDATAFNGAGGYGTSVPEFGIHEAWLQLRVAGPGANTQGLLTRCMRGQVAANATNGNFGGSTVTFDPTIPHTIGIQASQIAAADVFQDLFLMELIT